MNITPEERAGAIEAILDKGLTCPMPTHVFLKDMYRNLGLRIIFREATPGLLCTIIFVALFTMLLILQLGHTFDAYAFVFLLSPAVFIGLTVSTEIIERTSGLFDIKMTCKYSIRQISALRLLIFSLIGTVSTVAGCLIIYHWLTISPNAPDLTGAINFINLLSLALSSLFLCSLLIIHVMRRWRRGWYLGALIWAALSLIPMMFFEQTWNRLLTNLSPIVALSVTVVALGLFLREVKLTTRGESNYAYS